MERWRRAAQPASRQSFPTRAWACREDETIAPALENHSSHCCEAGRNGKVYQPLPNGSWQVQLDTWRCSLVLLKSARADSRYHQDRTQPFRRHIRPLTHRVCLFFHALPFPLLKAKQKTLKAPKKHIFCHPAKPGWTPLHILPGPPGLPDPTLIWHLTARCTDGSKPPHKPSLWSTSFDVGDACHHAQAGMNRSGSPSPSLPPPCPQTAAPPEELARRGGTHLPHDSPRRGTQSAHPARTHRSQVPRQVPVPGHF